MKMVKSLLLGTAAGLVAMTGAQAADLPVKAKPVQYVKICSLYGAGFYYIPGTDMCIKVGGWVRAETSYHTNGSSTAGWSSGDLNNNYTSDWWWRARGYLTADARNQSEYGTIRSYIAVGLSGDNAVAFSANRAFIQVAGFTAGLTQSFFDFYNAPATSYHGWNPSEDTGDGGKFALAYTAQFGGGMSASISAEDPRSTQIINANLNRPIALSAVSGAVAASNSPSVFEGSVTGGAYTTSALGGIDAPDVVGNLRIDQAWGSAQVMGAMHLVNAHYYNAGANNLITAAGPQYENSGAPADKWGFAVGAGLKLNAPMIGPGDYFQAEVNYTEGAPKYLMAGVTNGNYYLQNGTSAGYGILTDAVYGGSVAAGTATGLNLTTAWGVNAAYEHFWNKQWRTSAYYGYTSTKFNAQANAQLCTAQYDGSAMAGGGLFNGTNAVANPGCNNNWNFWFVGTRTQYNITPDTYLGLDVAYSKLESATTSTGTSTGGTAIGANTSSPTIPANTVTGLQSPRTIGNVDNWAVRFRVHRDFYP